MPHPKGGYFLKDGTRVPGVTTITGRFKESGGLIHWAWNEGKEGRDYRETRDAAAGAGTLAHAMVEQWIHGQPVTVEGPEDVVAKARTAFSAFLEWAGQSQLKVTHTELSLVSEKHRFGGTIDAVMIGGKRALGDWKSANQIYADNLIQVGGGYKLLWDEHYSNDPILGGIHIVRFDKQYGDFEHRFYPELASAERAFLLMRELYEIDKELKQRTR